MKHFLTSYWMVLVILAVYFLAGFLAGHFIQPPCHTQEIENTIGQYVTYIKVCAP